MAIATGVYFMSGAFFSVSYEFRILPLVEIVLGFISFVLYLFVPAMEHVIFGHLYTALMTGYVFSVLYLDDYNMLFVLFLLPLLTMPSFILIGKKAGIIWSIIIELLLLVTIALDHFGIAHTHFKSHLLATFGAGIAVLSLIWFWVVDEREFLDERLDYAHKNSKLLFKEVHHRTKNNMQVIISLLESQLLRSQDPSYKRLFQTYIDRIKTMSYVHENLYRTGTSSRDRIDMRKYLGEVLSNLQHLTQHTIISDIDPIKMSLKHAMSIGLIVNEGVSNAIEHAYDAGRERIDVALKHLGRDCILEIRDYGRGFNHHKEFNSLGLRLIKDLSNSLPHGRMSFMSDNGMRIQVIFDCPHA